jgi:hypothetical protein
MEVFFHFLLLYWGNTVTFTKFLQYIIVEFTPSIILLYLPFLHSWNSFNRSHFSIYVENVMIFTLLHPFLIFSHLLILYIEMQKKKDLM